MGVCRKRVLGLVRVRGLVTYSILATLVVAAPAAAGPAVPGRPNILVMLSDDQRADTIAALGNRHIRTPNLDRLVRRGTAFTRAYCMGSLQGAVCVPSRAMILSGRTLFRVKDELTGQSTWPESFRNAGYTTFLTGKWHNEADSALRLFDQGKAIFLGGMGDPYDLPLEDISPRHVFVRREQSGAHSVKLFADAAIEFLRSQTDDAPFLCYVAFNAPHDPRTAPPSFHKWYNAHQPPLPANFLPQHPFDNGEMAIRDERLAPWPRTPEVVRQHLADYYASIEFLDEHVGRILGALEASGRLENTLVVFASDHGLAIGSHGLFGKQNLYEHSMNSPLIISGPGIPQGKRIAALCYLLDIFPTLGELAGVAGPEGNEGHSLAPILAGRQNTVYSSIFTAYTDVQRAARDERWKLIVYPQINTSQFFDLESDPFEMHDLANDPKFASEQNRLTTLLRDWQRQLDDPQPLTSPSPRPKEFDFSTVEP
jgi:arylsulfatase A-like enzyme